MHRLSINWRALPAYLALGLGLLALLVGGSGRPLKALTPTATSTRTTTPTKTPTGPMPTGVVGSRTISGTVKNAQGAPIAGATVSCSHYRYVSVTGPRCEGTRTSAADGSFSFGEVLLRDTDSITVKAGAMGYTSSQISRNGINTYRDPVFNLVLTRSGATATPTRTPSRTNTISITPPPRTAPPTRTNTSTTGYPAWTTWTAFGVGARVSHNGLNYQCLQAHTSQPGWEPPNVPALWQRI